jgi:hypothetical protein
MSLNFTSNAYVNHTVSSVSQVLGQMLFTAELDMANSVTPNDINVFLDNVAWAIHSTYHTVLKASPDAAIFWLKEYAQAEGVFARFGVDSELVSDLSC